MVDFYWFLFLVKNLTLLWIQKAFNSQKYKKFNNFSHSRK
jgi:hypothetical protein